MRTEGIIQLLLGNDQRRPQKPAAAGRGTLDFRLLGYFQCIIDLDAEIAYRAFQLDVAKQELYGSQVLSTPVNQDCLGATHRLGAVDSGIQPD